MHHMWQGYLRSGRQELTKLGERTVIAPSLSPGFAVADLVEGRTLVDIKASAEPAKHYGAWLNRLLGYLLLARFNIFCWEAVAIYLGWHAATLSISVRDLLATSSAGVTHGLSDLRAEFHKVSYVDANTTVIDRVYYRARWTEVRGSSLPRYGRPG
ncbi:hypothetical protein ACQEU6_38555 [Spirillospora sp. CA-108201]